MTREFYDERLHSMLQFKRPHGTHMELDWAKKFIDPYTPDIYGDKDVMAYVVHVGAGSKVLFSAHVDTVHREEGKQKVFYDQSTHRYFKKDGLPLGADDGAGVWLLLEMIDAGVAGTYIFHRGEECGGIGSSWMSKCESKWLRQFDYAIAFDRKATDSIITHQSGGRCCSDVFANGLADALNDANMHFMYSPDQTGVYTDTAEYTDEIAECTNVSCGYYSEHTGKEELDLMHLFALRDACMQIDWASLPIAREPGEVDKDAWNRFSPFDINTWKPTDYSGVDFWALDREDMIDFAIEDPEAFVDMLRAELFEEPENWMPREAKEATVDERLKRIHEMTDAELDGLDFDERCFLLN